MNTLEAYCILGGRDFLITYGEPIANTLRQVSPSFTDGRDLRALFQLLDAMVMSVPAEAPRLLAGVMPTLIKVCVENTAGDFTVVEALDS